MDHQNSPKFLPPILLSLLVSSCLASTMATPTPTLFSVTSFPALTPVMPSPTPAPVTPSPTPDLSTFEPVLGLYTDQEAEAFKERLERLVESLDGDPVPKDILDRVGIKVDVLRVIYSYVGGCPTHYTCELSPSYQLVVDDNACFGYLVHITQK